MIGEQKWGAEDGVVYTDADIKPFKDILVKADGCIKAKLDELG